MELEDWYSWYNRIASALKLDRHEDQRATDILSDLIQNRSIEPYEIRTIIYNKPALVFGAGPSLEDDIQRIEKVGLFDKFITIAYIKCILDTEFGD